MFACSSVTFAATALTGVRFHSGTDHDRVVLDLAALPSYTTRVSADGRELTVDMADTAEKNVLKEGFSGKRIESVRYAVAKGHVLVTIRLKAGYTYEVKRLANPARIFVDVKDKAARATTAKGTNSQATTGKSTTPSSGAVKKPATSSKPATSGTTTKPAPKKTPTYDESKMTALEFDGLYNEMMAPGIMRREYIYWDEVGEIRAYFVEADASLYRMRPVLARGIVPGLATTSRMSDDNNAVAAINATYFALNGDMIGMVKMDGAIAGTTYYRRSAVAEKADGSLTWGRVSYDGEVTLGGVMQRVGAVNAERGADMLVIYNKHYGSRTKTNEYGAEYTVRGGRVTAVGVGNSAIPADGYVISVHGTAADAYKDVQVGDAAVINETMGEPWDSANWVMGAGPRLVVNGRATNTAAAEEFPSDIRVGRAPRSAVAILRNGNYLFGVVDGRQEHSKGLTLTAWGELLVKMGAYNAINLDGGGSSALVIGGNLQNSPSDGHERSVGSALIIEAK